MKTKQEIIDILTESINNINDCVQDADKLNIRITIEEYYNSPYSNTNPYLLKNPKNRYYVATVIQSDTHKIGLKDKPHETI